MVPIKVKFYKRFIKNTIDTKKGHKSGGQVSRFTAVPPQLMVSSIAQPAKVLPLCSLTKTSNLCDDPVGFLLIHGFYLWKIRRH